MVEPRSGVLWFGKPPTRTAKKEFSNRNLVLTLLENDVLLPSLAPVTTTVFAFDSSNVDALAPVAIKHARVLVDYGVRVDIVASDDRVLATVQNAFNKIPVTSSRLHFRTAPAPFEIPERAARHQSGPRPRLDLEIVVDRSRPILIADEPLFRRAFSHCSKIVLVELTGGRSAARVFAVHMTVDTSLAGVRPQPFFAKVDVREKIENEFQNYELYADRFIPFGLRPNVREIVRGAERSLLSGDFVDRSESLWELVRRNVAAEAISALVEETLLGWRNQAYAEDQTKGAVAAVMAQAGICDPQKVKSCYVEHAERSGVDVDVATLWAKLLSLDQQNYRLAPMHGDLHGENVRVRNGQAILIDLASVTRGPLTADLAALETWLAFELPPEEDKVTFENLAWLSEIDRLYAPSTFQHPPGPCEPTADYCWMATAVRQIRHMGIAAQSCATEYQTAVAVQLLRRCQWEDGDPADHFRRGHGYITATKLVDDLVCRSAS